jgi:hypothetical protein
MSKTTNPKCIVGQGLAYLSLSSFLFLYKRGKNPILLKFIYSHKFDQKTFNNVKGLFGRTYENSLWLW